MKKAIVIDPMGFIGFGVCKRLISEGFEVKGVQYPKWYDGERHIEELKIDEIGRHAHFLFVDQLCDEKKVINNLKDLDVIYYCVYEPNRIDDKEKKAWEIEKNNIETLLHEYKHLKPMFIYVSSLEIYSQSKNVVTEKTKPMPKTPFGKLKHAGEQLVINYFNSCDFYYNIVRLPTVYGPWQPSYMTYQDFLLHRPSKLKKDSFCEDVLFSEDVSEGLFQVFNHKLKNEIIHLTSGKQNQWEEGLKVLGADWLLNSDSCNNITFSARKAKHKLNFIPKTTISDGLKKQKDYLDYLNRMKRLGLLS